MEKNESGNSDCVIGAGSHAGASRAAPQEKAIGFRQVCSNDFPTKETGPEETGQSETHETESAGSDCYDATTNRTTTENRCRSRMDGALHRTGGDLGLRNSRRRPDNVQGR